MKITLATTLRRSLSKKWRGEESDMTTLRYAYDKWKLRLYEMYQFWKY